MRRAYLKRSDKPLRAKSALTRTKWSPKPKRGKRALEAQADSLLQAVVVSRGRKCQVCGQKRATEGHHIIRRKYHALRWKARYVIDLCHECHDLDGEPEFNRACIEWLGGPRVYERLRRHAEHGQQQTAADAIADMQKCLDNQSGLRHNCN